MYPQTATKTRSTSGTCTAARVEAALAPFLGDLVSFLASGLLSRERMADWYRDLFDVLALEAIARFQIKVLLPNGIERALDYEVSDDGRISGGDLCGGFSTQWIPPTARVSLVLRYRLDAPKLAEAQVLLKRRGWGDGKMLDVTGSPDRSYSKDGYGFYRRTVGEWPA